MIYINLQVPIQPQARYSEPDNRDWRGRAPPPADERSWDGGRDFNRSDSRQEPNSQFGRTQASPNQGVSSSIILSYSTSFSFSYFLWILIELIPNGVYLAIFVEHLLILEQMGGSAPALVKAETPWSVRRGTLSEKDRVLKTVKG